MKIYRAYYDSRNFSFEAFSLDRDKAIATCLQALKGHGKSLYLDLEWYVIDGSDCIEVTEYELDRPYIDRDLWSKD